MDNNATEENFICHKLTSFTLVRRGLKKRYVMTFDFYRLTVETERDQLTFTKLEHADTEFEEDEKGNTIKFECKENYLRINNSAFDAFAYFVKKNVENDIELEIKHKNALLGLEFIYDGNGKRSLPYMIDLTLTSESFSAYLLEEKFGDVKNAASTCT